MLAWFAGSFALLGDLGRFSDDWSLNLRNPVDGAYHFPDSPFSRWNYFWRPLHLLTIHAVATAAPGQDWARHLLSAACHGAVAILFYRFLKRLEVPQVVRVLATLVLLCHPVIYEAVLWPSTLSTLVACAMLLALWTRALDIAQGRHAVPRAWLMPPVWCAYVFAMACFYEQQAAAACATGLLAFAAPADEAAPDPAGRRRRALIGAVMMSGAAAAACGLYMTLLTLSAPASVRGGSAALSSPVEAAARFAGGIGRAAGWIAGPTLAEFGHGADVWADGWRFEPGLLLKVLPMLLFGSAVFWGWAAFEAGGAGTALARPRGKRCSARAQVVALLLGAAALLLAIAPGALTGSRTQPARLMYFPLVCVLLAGACAVSLAARRWFAPGRGAPGLGMRVAALALAGGIAGACLISGLPTLVIAQGAMQCRSRADERIAAELRRLVPDPPAGTTFLPVRIDLRLFDTGARAFDGALPSALEQPWAAWALVQSREAGYGRRDVLCAHVRANNSAYTLDSDGATGPEVGVRYRPRWATPPPWVPRGGWFVPWDRCVPFVVDPSGGVRIVDRLIVPREGRDALEVRPALVREMLGRGRLEPVDVTSAELPVRRRADPVERE